MESNQPSGPLIDTTALLQTVLGLWVYFLLSLLWRILCYVVFAALAAGAVYWMFRRPEDYRGVIGGVAYFLIAGVLVVPIAIQTALLATFVKAFEKIGIGRMIFDYLLARIALGRAAETVEEAESVSMSAHGVTASQLRDALKDVATELLSQTGIDRKVPLLARRITKKVFSIATWGVVKIVLSYVGQQTADGSKTLDMNQLRSQAGEQIDAQLWGSVQTDINRQSWLFARLAVFGTLAIAVIIRLCI